jgi:TRAP-type C4-dicarboxylate transport system substrate-binding protein
MHFKSLVSAALALACAATSASADTPIRWLSQSLSSSAEYPIEMAVIEAINADGFSVERSEFQGLGISTMDGLRLARTGTFDVISMQVGQVAADDPFLEGIDLIGVSVNLDELDSAVNAYRDVFSARLDERFGVRPVAIWAFGGQIFFCSEPIQTLADLQGMKVRSFTASMSALLEGLGASPVTLPFPEVYPALQRGVATCGITSANSANTGKWPEVTTHVLPLAVASAVQAHVVNGEWWDGLTAEEQAKLTTHFNTLETNLMALARRNGDLAVSCTTGGPCESDLYTAYDLELVELAPDDLNTLRSLSEELVLADWAERCERVYEGCGAVWNATVGAARGMTIPGIQ